MFTFVMSSHVDNFDSTKLIVYGYGSVLSIGL